MSLPARRLRTPEERVGGLPNASLPPPVPGGAVTVSMDSEELLTRALVDRDEAAFASVLDVFYPAMLRIALMHVRDRAVAEEVVQDCWIAALDGVSRFEGRSSLRTWLFRVLRNVARARGRKEDRTRPVSSLMATDTDLGDSDPSGVIVDGRTAAAGYGRGALWASNRSPEEDLLSGELAKVLTAAIARLPQRQREVLLLRDVDGLSAAEVCNILAISDTNQRVILHRARDRVRNELRGYVQDGAICFDGERNDVH